MDVEVHRYDGDVLYLASVTEAFKMAGKDKNVFKIAVFDDTVYEHIIFTRVYSGEPNLMTSWQHDILRVDSNPSQGELFNV